jgi:hypothetical protein
MPSLNYNGLRTSAELENQLKAKLASSTSTGGYVRRFTAIKGRKLIEGVYHYGLGDYETQAKPAPMAKAALAPAKKTGKINLKKAPIAKVAAKPAKKPAKKK